MPNDMPDNTNRPVSVNNANRAKKPRTHTSDLTRLPAALEPLTEAKRWVCWQWAPRQNSAGEQEWTKPPFQPRDLRNARSNDPSTWDTYDRAVLRWQDGEVDGIGFMLADADIGAIDLDECCQRDASKKETWIDRWARELRAEANGAYCEVTVSGRGLRLIGTAKGDKIQRKFLIESARADAAIELYRNTNRYITISGIQIGQCELLTPLDDLLDTVQARYDQRNTKRRDRLNQRQRGDNRNYDDLIRNGAPVGERSELFHSAVWHLANQGHSIDEIERMLAQYSDGIAERYIAEDRLRNEVERSYGKWQQRNPTQRDDLPVIRVVDGQIARVVDQAQSALIDTGLPIFVNVGRLVEPITVERDAADGRTTPSTVLARIDGQMMRYLLNKHAAVFERYDGRRQTWRVTNPPSEVAAMLLGLKHWQFPEVIGVVGAPTMRADGTVLNQTGYDPQTRLWCYADMDLPPIPDRPTHQQAMTALRLYMDLLSGFPFVSETDLAVALAAILTVVLRGAFDLTPMFLVVAHDVGNGKSYLVDLLATLVTGRCCPVMSPGSTSEEMEKRLGAVLLEGGSVVSLDNLSFDLDSDLLCQILTRKTVKVRRLGVSEVPECEWRGTIFATGNNVRVRGDLVRRTLTCNLDAKVERPELRKFRFDPIARVHSGREDYIAAAITIVRAYRAVGRDAVDVRPLGGYAAWSAAVREPLLWLGEHDPVKSMDAARAADPMRAAAYQLVEDWQALFGIDKVVSVRDIIDTANRTREPGVPGFRALLLEHAGTQRGDEIVRNRLGTWLRQQHGKVYAGLRIDLVQHKGAANEYVLRQIDDHEGAIDR
jgi:putative DNA primase/helicase